MSSRVEMIIKAMSEITLAFKHPNFDTVPASLEPAITHQYDQAQSLYHVACQFFSICKKRLDLLA